MKIVAHTPHGVFNGNEIEYNEEQYKLTGSLLEKLHQLEYFSFETPNGEIYMNKEMIDKSVFVLEK